MQKRAIAGSRFDLLARMRAGARTGRLPSVMTPPPTLTAQAANVTTLATTHAAMVSSLPSGKFDAHGFGLTTGPDTAYMANKAVNYGTTVGANLATNPWDISFATDAPAFEIGIRGSSSSKYRMLVDEGYGPRLASATPVADKTNDGNVYYDLWTFADRRPREITLFVDTQFYLRRIKTDALSSVWLPRRNPNRVRAVFLGDSYTEKTGADYPDGIWAYVASYLLGWDCYLSGVGGTGYLNAGGTHMTFRQRFAADVSAFHPDVIVIAGGINDSAFTQSQVQTEAALLFAQARAENPNAIIFVPGPWTAHNSTPAAVNVGIKAAAQAADGYGTRLFFIETMTDVAGAWQFGTGRVGATTGDGNSDIYTGTDNTHPPQIGHTYLGYRFADAVRAAIGA